jgi:hypothetical protein
MTQTENGNRYAITALKDRRASVAGEISACQKRLVWLKESLGHIDGALRIMDEVSDPESIPPKKPYRHVKLFARGELNGLIYSTLRKAARPLSTPEIVSGVLTELGHDGSVAKGMNHRVRANLQYLHRDRKTVEKLGVGRETKWRLATQIA